MRQRYGVSNYILIIAPISALVNPIFAIMFYEDESARAPAILMKFAPRRIAARSGKPAHSVI